MIDAIHANRRARVLERLGPDAALVVAAGPELRAGPDGEIRYTPDAELYWLTGYEEPGAVLALCPSNPDGPFVLFVRPRDPERELWTGVRGGTEAALSEFGADAAFPVDELGRRLPKMLGHVSTLFARLESGRSDVDALVTGMLAAGRRSRPRRGKGPHTITDPGVLLDDLRRTKDDTEIARLREAARVTVESVRAAASTIRPGAGEWQVEAAIEGGFRSCGARGPAFPTIVAAGANATTLHYVSNRARMQKGELLLIDAGARVDMYCADISRTFPVAGRFTPEQRAAYDIVLAAHDAAIAAVAPGVRIADVHAAARRVLAEGLIELGFFAGEPDALLEQEDAWKTYYPHQTSHWLGLDVHDVGAYVEDGEATRLAPGMVFTVEPGLYVPAAAEVGPPSLRGTGIRIEDDVLVTADGFEVLTAALPADADGVVEMLGEQIRE